jgi:hypothetical protein
VLNSFAHILFNLENDNKSKRRYIMSFYYDLIEAEKRRLYFANNNLPLNAFYKWKNLHRTEESLKFLQKCDENNLTPTFLKISLKNVRQIGLKPAEIFRMKKRKLIAEKNFKLEKIKTTKIQFDH